MPDFIDYIYTLLSLPSNNIMPDFIDYIYLYIYIDWYIWRSGLSQDVFFRFFPYIILFGLIFKPSSYQNSQFCFVKI